MRSTSLCPSCIFVRRVGGRQDQTYYLCRNEAIPEKYPRQPVRSCDGYAPQARGDDSATE